MLGWQEANRAAGNPRITPMPPLCPACGYNLTGTPSNICPECGREFSREKVIQDADRRWWEVRFHLDANRDTTYGLILIAVGWMVLGVGSAINVMIVTNIKPFVIGIVLVLAVLGTILGGRVFRLLRIPEEAREHLPIKPKFGRGVMALASGFLLVLCNCLVP